MGTCINLKQAGLQVNDFISVETALKFKMLHRTNDFPFETALVGKRCYYQKRYDRNEIIAKPKADEILDTLLQEIVSKFGQDDSVSDYSYAMSSDRNGKNKFMIAIHRKTKEVIGKKSVERRNEWNIKNYKCTKKNKLISKTKEETLKDEICRLLLENGYDFGPHYRFEKCCDLEFSRNIDYATECSLSKSMMFLLDQQNADVNQDVFSGSYFENTENVFRLAVSNDFYSPVKKMLSDKKVDWNRNLTVLHEINSLQMTELLLEYIDKEDDITKRKILNARYKGEPGERFAGRTPLMRVCSHVYGYLSSFPNEKFMGMYNALIRAGADREAQFKGWVMRKYQECTAIGFIDDFINDDQVRNAFQKQQQNLTILQQDDYYWKPLLIAARDGDLEAIKKLPLTSADVLAKTQYGQTASELTTNPKIKQYLRHDLEVQRESVEWMKKFKEHMNKKRKRSEELKEE